MNLTRRSYEAWVRLRTLGIFALALLWRPGAREVQRVLPSLGEGWGRRVGALLAAVAAAGVLATLAWLEQRYVQVDGLTLSELAKRAPRKPMSREERRRLLILGSALFAIQFVILVIIWLASKSG